MHGTHDNVAAASGADLVVLAVKPQDMATAARSLAAAAGGARRVVLSIAAGIRLANLATWLGGHVPVVRAMPNRPALIGAGITAACTGPGVSETERARAEWVLAAAGPVVWLDDESQMDAVTAVSGSGPAYFFLLIEAHRGRGRRRSGCRGRPPAGSPCRPRSGPRAWPPRAPTRPSGCASR